MDDDEGFLDETGFSPVEVRVRHHYKESAERLAVGSRLAYAISTAVLVLAVSLAAAAAMLAASSEQDWEAKWPR